MKKTILIIGLFILFSGISTVEAASFNSTWVSSSSSPGSSNSNQIKLPLYDGGTYNFTVFWGDGNSDHITAFDQSEVTHTYGSAGTYNLSINGTIIGWRFNNEGDRLKIIDISNWGDLNLGNLGSYFRGCSYLNSSATDQLNLTGTTNLGEIFMDAHDFNGNISNWDVSSVQDMSQMFFMARDFNQDISSWDVSSVQDMSQMFLMSSLSMINYENMLISWSQLNVQDNVSLDVGSTKYRTDIAGAAKDILTDTYSWTITDGGIFIDWFNSTWNTSKTSTGSSNSNQIKLPLTSVGTYNFTVFWGDGTNNTITAYDQAEVTHTYGSAGVYNVSIYGTLIGWIFSLSNDKLKIIDISNWGDLNLGNLGGYFYGCSNLNISATDQPDLTGTTNLEGMFYQATNFNANISNWDVSNVTNMYRMFSYTHFNQDISSWDVSNVTNMRMMFNQATNFNQDIGSWDVSSVTDMDSLFASTSLSSTNYENMLINWSQLNVQDNVPFGVGNTQYTTNTAAAARDILTGTYGWVITDGGTNLDTDNDGVSDSSDRLYYNESNVTTSGITNLNITVAGNSTSGNYNGNTYEINVYDGSDLMINFSHNFDANSFDLSKVKIIKTSTSLIVNLSGQLQSNQNKTLYITDNSFIGLCVKDAEISSISEISSRCTGANETDFTACLGGNLTSNGIICTDLGSTIKIENLRHSAVLGTQASSSSRSSSGGSGYCSTEWVCSDWSICIDNKQTRECTYPKNWCEPIVEKPIEMQDCVKELDSKEDLDSTNSTINSNTTNQITTQDLNTEESNKITTEEEIQENIKDVKNTSVYWIAPIILILIGSVFFVIYKKKNYKK